jgi:transketolase N-terminal domain/subunit
MTATVATAPSAATIEAIKQRAKRLSILSMMSTTAAGSGHPTSCMSAAELVAGTFFYAMKFDPKDPTRRMAIVSFSPKATPRRSFTPRSLRQEFSRSRV